MQVSYYQGTHLHQISTSVAKTAELLSMLIQCGYTIIHVKEI